MLHSYVTLYCIFILFNVTWHAGVCCFFNVMYCHIVCYVILCYIRYDVLSYLILYDIRWFHFSTLFCVVSVFCLTLHYATLLWCYMFSFAVALLVLCLVLYSIMLCYATLHYCNVFLFDLIVSHLMLYFATILCYCLIWICDVTLLFVCVMFCLIFYRIKLL